MLYTVMGEEAVLGRQGGERLRSTRLGGVPVLLDGAGVVRTVLTSDPAAYLMLHRCYPCGRTGR